MFRFSTREFFAVPFAVKSIFYGGSLQVKFYFSAVVYNFIYFHNLLLRSYLYHCVWSAITAHNLTPEKRDNN